MKQDSHQEGIVGAPPGGERERTAPRKRLLTASEAAEYLGLAEQTVRNWASTGKLPKVRAHGCLRFDIKALDRWIADHSEKERE